VKVPAFAQKTLIWVKKRKAALLVALPLLVITPIVTVTVLRGKAAKAELPEIPAPEPQIQRSVQGIPVTEIYWPPEPDFVPDVLLEREKKTAWTASEAAVYWKDPVENTTTLLSDFAHDMDALLEKVP